MAKAEEEVNMSRNDLITAMKNKNLGKLNEIQYDQFLYHEKHKYEKHIDELTTLNTVESNGGKNAAN